ncbi:MAG: hypothetical protein IPJ56_05225 [Gemmatimonadetes bacterium]|nr:hypothetical protein [Gemmatimonadota bacterium]
MALPDSQMLQTPSLLAVAIPTLVVGVAVGVLIGRRGAGAPEPVSTEGEPSTKLEAGDRIRSQALEAAAEPVLLVGADGRVLDCNAAALTLFDRHRPAVTAIEASVIRSLVSLERAPRGVGRPGGDALAVVGEAHVRLPDRESPGDHGSAGAGLRGQGRHRGARRGLSRVPDRCAAPRRPFPHALDTGGESGDVDEPADAAQRELRLLAMGFADLDQVVRQYELLLPAMRAEDPLAEAIAGLAAETSEVATAADAAPAARAAACARAAARAHAATGRAAGLGAPAGATEPALPGGLARRPTVLTLVRTRVQSGY